LFKYLRFGSISNEVLKCARRSASRPIAKVTLYTDFGKEKYGFKAILVF